jgi:penicillin amidase
MPTQVADRLILQVSMGGDSLWLASEGEESLSRIALRAFRRAVGYLVAKHGARLERWRWGKEHTIRFSHLAGTKKRWLRPFVNLGPYPLGGSEVTLNHPSFSQLQPFQATVAATWRHIVDMSAPDEARDISAPGQSGHLLSPHYADQLSAWMRGELQPMLMRHRDIHKSRSLVLKPK